MPRDCDIAIVGAGAAGLATAIFARQEAPHARVVLLDGASRPGAKILVSGGSRCNVTNATVDETDFWTSGRRSAIRGILRALPVPETVAWFAALGVTLHEEERGKLFPDSHRSRDVLDALLRAVHASGARLCAGARVTGVVREGDGFSIATAAGELRATAVVLATGGQSLPKSGSDGAGFGIAASLGHTIVPTTPALVPLVLSAGAERPLHARLSGVALPVTLSVWRAGRVAIRLTGPLLWTHFGVSGPAVLDASRHWERARIEGDPVRLTANLFPGLTFDRLDRDLTAAAVARPKAAIHSILARSLPASVAQAWPELAGLAAEQPLSSLTRDARRRLSHALVEWELPVSGSRGFTHAEATAGGVSIDEIDARSMASRVCRGLSLVGEVLDVDGRLGGFNFQWAWATARVAARGLGRG